MCPTHADTTPIQCLFEPRVIDFEEVKQGVRPSQESGVSEDIIDVREPRDALMEKYVRRSVPACGLHTNTGSQTQAMIISTQHLFATRNLTALENATTQNQNQ